MNVDREEDTCFYLRFVYILISYAAKFVCIRKTAVKPTLLLIKLVIELKQVCI